MRSIRPVNSKLEARTYALNIAGAFNYRYAVVVKLLEYDKDGEWYRADAANDLWCAAKENSPVCEFYDMDEKRKDACEWQRVTGLTDVFSPTGLRFKHDFPAKWLAYELAVRDDLRYAVVIGIQQGPYKGQFRADARAEINLLDRDAGVVASFLDRESDEQWLDVEYQDATLDS